MESKRCTKCKTIKPYSEFYKDSRSRDGLRQKCKNCHLLQISEYRKNNPEIIKCQNQRWYKTHVEQVRLSSKSWRSRNKERVKNVCAEWYKNHQEKTAEERKKKSDLRKKETELRKIDRENRKVEIADINKSKRREKYLRDIELIKFRNRRWRKNNPEASRVLCRNRYAKVKRIPGNGWDSEDEKLLIEEYGHRCAYCGKITPKITIDHVIPLTRGGLHEIENAVPACQSCNSSKNNKPLLIWLRERNLRWIYEQLGKVSI
jgi:hypothetical protein